LQGTGVRERRLIILPGRPDAKSNNRCAEIELDSN
jgi:hypothetical protein